MKPKGVIDSINFSSETIEDLFCDEDYIIEVVKSHSVFEPERWSKTFKKALTRNIVEAKILHTNLGLTLPIKRYAVTPQKQTLEFAGLHGYDEYSRLLRELLKELLEHLEESFVTRIDIAIDFKGKIPNKVIKSLCKDREPFRYGNTTYYKSKKEKRSNTRLNIKTYMKSKQKKLSYELERLEFVFQSQYFNKLQLKDLAKAFKKMEKTINRFAGVKVEILSFKETL